MSHFDAAVNWVLTAEGSDFTDNPADAGGPTKYGITLETYKTYYPQATADTLKVLTRVDAEGIYRVAYWDLLCGDLIEDQGAAVMLMDVAVLCGRRFAVTALQSALTLRTDGIMGPITRNALNGSGPRLALVLGSFWERYLRHLATACVMRPQNVAFLGGWTERALRLLPLFAYRAVVAPAVVTAGSTHP